MQVHANDLDELGQISVDAARRNPGLIVWPESPAPFSLQDAVFAARAQQLPDSVLIFSSAPKIGNGTRQGPATRQGNGSLRTAPCS